MANQERRRKQSVSNPPAATYLNSILSNLPSAEFNQLKPKLQRMTLESGDILYNPEEVMRWGYFVESGIVSLVAVMSSGGDVEVGIIGHEGLVGHQIVLNGKRSVRRAIVQLGPLTAYRITAENLRRAYQQLPVFRARIARYIRGQSEMTAQTAACNSQHEVEERLAKWLLMCRDRMGSDTLTVTQEFLGNMLGVRRTTVTVVAGTLSKAGLIKYSRGKITILKCEEMEDLSCECYRMLKEQYLELREPNGE
jgi:CRP-like cAMP-binding protein